jgi:hypothetical protein
MVNRLLVIDDRIDKRNDGSLHRILSLSDQSRPALTHTLAYEPKGDDLTKLPEAGKAVDLEMDVAIRAIKWNNFQLCQEISLGTIMKVYGHNGENGAGAAKPVGK